MSILIYIAATITYCSAVEFSSNIQDPPVQPLTSLKNKLFDDVVDISRLRNHYNIQAESPRIAGGENTRIGFHPHQVSLRYRFAPSSIGHFCGGSIISKNIIVTVTGCTFLGEDTIPTENLFVTAGTDDLQDTSVIITRVKRVMRHPQYIKGQSNFNIALLLLEKSLPLNDIDIGAIALAEYGPTEDDIGTVTGWGQSIPDPGSPMSQALQMLDLPIVSRRDCNFHYNNTITPSIVCAGGIPDVGTCIGDNGGPLVVNGKLAGVILKGCSRFLDLFAKVSYMYPWMKKVIDIYD